MSYFQSTDFPDGVYLVGDIHGDIAVFLTAGVLSGTFFLDRGVVCWRTGKKALLIFLGDVVNNSRPGGPPGVDLKETDKLILLTMSCLQKQAQKQGGNIVLVVGNHELGYITNSVSCQRYSHQNNCNREGKYKKKVSAWMIEQLQELKSVSVCMVDQTLICHGGVPAALKPVTVNAINEEYRTFLEAASPGVDTNTNTYIFHHLAWHRPCEFVQKDVQQITHENKVATALVVGHTPVYEQMESSLVIDRTEKNEVKRSERVSLVHQLVRLDFAMSRAFTTAQTPSQQHFCLLCIAQLLPGDEIQFIYKTHKRCRLEKKPNYFDQDRTTLSLS